MLLSCWLLSSLSQLAAPPTLTQSGRRTDVQGQDRVCPQPRARRDQERHAGPAGHSRPQAPCSQFSPVSPGRVCGPRAVPGPAATLQASPGSQQDAPTPEVSRCVSAPLSSVHPPARSPSTSPSRADAGCVDSVGGRRVFELHVGLCSQVSSNLRNVGSLGSECKQGFSQNRGGG